MHSSINALSTLQIPKNLGLDTVCCLSCKILKNLIQFYEQGCENCTWLHLKGNNHLIGELTTSKFSGVMAVINPLNSWIARWYHISNGVPGLYAMKIPEYIFDHL